MSSRSERPPASFSSEARAARRGAACGEKEGGATKWGEKKPDEGFFAPSLRRSLLRRRELNAPVGSRTPPPALVKIAVRKPSSKPNLGGG